MPVLTITTDFGTSDHLVGIIKGEILKQNDGFTLIDITHEPTNTMQVAYLCKSLFRSFPMESFHLILVNAFDRNSDHLLLVRHNNQFLGIPDNGLITMIVNGRPDEVVALPLPAGQTKGVRLFTSVIIEAFSKLLSGMPMTRVGTEGVGYLEKNIMRPNTGNNFIEGQILMIDRFRNVIVNITLQDFEQARMGRPFKIVLLGNTFIEKISQHYAEVPPGEKLAFFNEAGYLEIAVNKGPAAPLFGLGEFNPDAQVHHERMQFYQTVKIYFE